MDAGVGVAPTATWLMRPVGSLDLPAMVGTVGIAPTPSRLQRDVQTIYTTFPKNWQVLRDSHPPGRFWRPTRPLERLGPMVPEAGRRRFPLFERPPCTCEHLSAKVVERDGYAPSPPHCKCGVLLLSLRPQRWARRRDLHPRPSVLQAGPLAARARRDGNRTAAQVTRREKTSLTSVLNDRGLRFGGAGGSCTRTVRIKSPLC